MRCSWSARRVVCVIASGLALGGCAASTPRASSAAVGAAQAPPLSEQASAARAQGQALPRFVVLHRERPLRLEPREDAPQIVFMSAQERAALESAERERAQRQAKAQAQANAEAKAKAKAKGAKPVKKSAKNKKRKRLTPAQREAQLKAKREREERELRQLAAQHVAALAREARRRPYPDPQTHYHALRVRRTLPQGWLELETLLASEQAQHCWRGGPPELASASLRVYVRQDQLSQVVVRLERLELAQGVQIKLQPGVVITRDGEQEVAQADGLSVKLKVPEDALSWGYSEPQRFEAPETDMTLSDVAFMRDELRIDQVQRVPYSPFMEQFVVATGTWGKRLYVTTQTPCMELRVLAQPSSIEALTGRRVTRIRGEPSAPPTAPYARAGAPLWRLDGSPLGQLSQPMTLGQETSAQDGRRCFALRLWAQLPEAPWRTLTLCLDSADVIQDG